MTLFTFLKTLHITCAMVSIAGFALRGYWAITGNLRLQQTLTRVLPHIIDTLLLASAVGMLWLWRVSPFAMPWIMAKIIALVLYILLGMVVLRYARSKAHQLAAYFAALALAAYIVSVALLHSPLGVLAIVGN